MSPNGAYAAGYWKYTPFEIDLPYACAAYWTPNGGSWANGGAVTDISAPILGRRNQLPGLHGLGGQ